MYHYDDHLFLFGTDNLSNNYIPVNKVVKREKYILFEQLPKLVDNILLSKRKGKKKMATRKILLYTTFNNLQAISFFPTKVL